MGQVLMGLTTASMKKKKQQQMCESSNVAKYWSSKQCYYGQLKRPFGMDWGRTLYKQSGRYLLRLKKKFLMRIAGW